MAFGVRCWRASVPAGRATLEEPGSSCCRDSQPANQAGQVAIRQQRQKQEQATELSGEAAWGRENSRQSATAAAVGEASAGARHPDAGQASEAFLVQDLPDAVALKGVCRSFKALSMSWMERFCLRMPRISSRTASFLAGNEVRASVHGRNRAWSGGNDDKNTKRAWGVSKAAGGVRRGKTFDEVGPESSYWRWKEEAGSRKKRDSGVRESGEFLSKQILTHML